MGGITHEVLGPWASTRVVGCEERKGLVERNHVDPVIEAYPSLSSLGLLVAVRWVLLTVEFTSSE